MSLISQEASLVKALYFEGKKPLIIPHRGGRNIVPENTLHALENTFVEKFSHFETDLRMSKDGVIFLHHDKSFDRTTDVSGNVKDFNWEEIKKINAGAKGEPCDSQDHKADKNRCASGIFCSFGKMMGFFRNSVYDRFYCGIEQFHHQHQKDGSDQHHFFNPFQGKNQSNRNQNHCHDQFQSKCGFISKGSDQSVRGIVEGFPDMEDFCFHDSLRVA